MSTVTSTSVRDLYEAIRADEAGTMSYDEVARHYAYSLPEHAIPFRSVDKMREVVTASGSHYFDADAVRFFRGKTDNTLYGFRFWVESRKYVNTFSGDSLPREYQVAWVSSHDGHLSIEKLGSFPTLGQARTAARRMAEAVTRS